MEKTALGTISSKVLSYYRSLYWEIRLQKFILNFHLSFQFLLDSVSTGWKIWTQKKKLNAEPLNQRFFLHEKGSDGQLRKGDIEKVMERLGILCDPDGKELQERFGEDEFSRLFEEQPSLEEVKEAFDVLDENRDGFINAKELQRVLRCLGLEKGLEVEECRRMIGAFDENGDGLINFHEFVKLMENCSY